MLLTTSANTRLMPNTIKNLRSIEPPTTYLQWVSGAQPGF
jgi:hypothetical protein